MCFSTNEACPEEKTKVNISNLSLPGKELGPPESNQKFNAIFYSDHPSHFNDSTIYLINYEIK